MTSKKTVECEHDHPGTEENSSFEEDDIEEDDYDDGDDSLWTDIRSAWRQHLVALAVAVLAAVAGFGYTNDPAMSEKLLSMVYSYRKARPASHLNNWSRLSHISFCLDKPLQPKERLHVLDFNIPKDLAPVLEVYAHETTDDSVDLEQVWKGLPRDEDGQVLLDHYTDPCLHNQIRNSRSFVKGTAYYYRPPQIAKPAPLSFTGYAAKFINLSPKPVLVFWQGRRGEERMVGEIAPYQAIGTATTPGQSFSVTPVYDSTTHLQRWVVTADTPINVYKDHDGQDSWPLYQQLLNLEFAKHYWIGAKRPWLAHFPRPPPVLFMHPVHTLEEKILLEDFEHPLVVKSLTPRVFQMEDFLSREECHHLIQLGQQRGLQNSLLHTGSTRNSEPATTRDLTTRSSTNTWLEREASDIVDAIYQRAAKLLQIDPALLQTHVEPHPHHAHAGSQGHDSLAESLQVVHYRQGGEYTAHHDFVYPNTQHPYQPTRFATLLFYLNTVEEGGETVFPRAVNPSDRDGLVVEPKQGRAVLFYNVLPDGNVDDLSQHASRPVLQGEKYMANLWVWDPVID